MQSYLGRIPKGRPGTLPLSVAGIIIEIALFVSLSERTLPLIALALLLAAGAFAARPERSTLALMASGSILGPVCEALPVKAGAWFYAGPDYWGMPIWLLLAYALFAVLVAQAGLSRLRPWT
jgi:hypothetical protein